MFRKVVVTDGYSLTFSDIYTNQYVYDERFSYNTLFALSIFGLPTRVQAAMAKIISKSSYYEIYIDGADGEFTFPSLGSLKVTSNSYHYKNIITRKISHKFIYAHNDECDFFGVRNRDDIVKYIRYFVGIPFPDDRDQDLIERLVERENIVLLRSYGFPDDVQFYKISSSKSYLEGVIKEFYDIEDFQEKLSLKVFLEENRKRLKEKVISHLKPIFSKDNLSNRDKKNKDLLLNLPKKPKEAQIEPILATTKALQYKNKKGVFLVGEMGTGKTFMSIATAKLLKAKRTVVMCPSHLIEKWEREILEVIPNAKILQLNNMSIGEILKLRGTKPTLPEFWIVGKEKAKLHYREKTISHSDDNVVCPVCGKKFAVKGKIYKCPNCGEKLIYADNTGPKRYAISLLLKKYFKFDLFIADEVHELKGGSTAQGQALANLAAASKKTLALTGTLMGGYASNLFYLLWRVAPWFMKEKIGISYNKLKLFVEKYGVLEHIKKYHQEHTQSIGRKVSVRTKEKPGISPELISEILENSIFVKLTDISNDLPPYKEEIVSVEMSEEQAREYETLSSSLISEVRKALARGDKKLLGKMVNSLYAYPDGARRGEIVEDADGIIAEASPIDEDLLPKEECLLDLVQQEKEAGRKVLVLLEHTGTRDLMPDLKERIEREGCKVACLYSNTVSPAKRERWIREQGDVDVLITNPRIIQTGLDLYEYPTIVFFQTGYSVFTLRQASRRSWRIGQSKPVKVYFLTYMNTIQEDALKLIASKLEAALSVEGDLSDKGLTVISESDNSMVIELAKNLVSGENSTPDDVKTVWSKAKKQELIADSDLTMTHQEVEKTTTTVTATTTTTVTIDGRKSTSKFTVVARVSVGSGKATFSLNGRQYTLKNGKIYLNNTYVGKYTWKKGKKEKYADCRLYNVKKRVFIGKQGQEYVAIELSA